VDTTLALIVSPVAGLVGVGLGYLGTRRLHRDEREAAVRAELQRALANYLAALYPLVTELREMPDVRVGKLAAAVDRLRGEAASYVISRQRIIRTLGLRPFELRDRIAGAAAQLQVLALPPALEAAVAASLDYVEQLSASRSDEVKGRWPGIWEALQTAAKSLQS